MERRSTVSIGVSIFKVLVREVDGWLTASTRRLAVSLFVNRGMI